METMVDISQGAKSRYWHWTTRTTQPHAGRNTVANVIIASHEVDESKEVA